MLLIAGCVFYGSWDWRFLILLFVSSGTDFIAARKIETSTIRKFWLVLSISVNLLILGFFKYYNFFASSFVELGNYFGVHSSYTVLNIVLPLGVSFYTFQSIAYVVDVYKNKVGAERSALHYFTFICFFPQMVAGPIERGRKMLPQFGKEKIFSRIYFETGINLLIYGFFKKVVIADNLAMLVDKVHSNPHEQDQIMLLAGIFAFSVQIYADFSGYTDIARGCAQLLGFKLSRNFYFPYFSSSLTQFWKRWHISLSTWFRDYVYIPLGGNKGSFFRRNINLLATFLVSGLWHGANFTFIMWGFFHGAASIVEKVFKGFKLNKVLTSLCVFGFVSVLFTLFRSPDLSHFLKYLYCLAGFGDAESGGVFNSFESTTYFLVPFVVFLLLEIIKFLRKGLSTYKFNLSTNMLLVLLILFFAVFENAPHFIYFQF